MTLVGTGTPGWVVAIDWAALSPALAMLSGALVALCADLLVTKRSFVLSWVPMVAGAAGAVAADVVISGPPFGFTTIISVSTLLVVLGSAVLHDDRAVSPGEFQFLVGSAAAGGLVIVTASELVTLLLGLELLTLPSIALVALRQGDRRAIGTAWTFFLTSVVSTAITLMGIALVYGVTGSLQYGELAVDAGGAKRVALTVGLVLTLLGFLFKLGAVPFHAWVPDAYRGASPVIAAFLSSASKAASLGALLLLLFAGFGVGVSEVGRPLLIAVAAVTMTVGNLGALRQRDGVGVLAWSSIAQVGFLLAPAAVGLLSLRQVGGKVPGLTSFAPVVQYLAVYVVANIVGFVALAIVLKWRGSTSYESLAGLGRTNPWVGVPLAFAVLTLAGFPPAIIGLVTKYVVFVPVIQNGPMWFAIVMAVNVMLGLAYYLKFVAVLFAAPDSSTETESSSSGTRVAIAVVILGALALIAASGWPSLVLNSVGEFVTIAG
jgi:NADH-quinone oxidoreductase subunit N